jgi:hypothetical protein
MDAKVLRAAVSAAIRVTVSTTLIGCGGNVTTDAGGARTPENNDSSSSHEPTNAAKGAGEQSSVPYPTNGTESNGANAGSTTAAGGAPVGGTSATGGVEVGGMANAAGAYEENSAGAPTQTCVPAAEACLTTLEQAPAAQPPSAAVTACCESVLQAISLPSKLSDECFDGLNARFMQIAVRPKCCTDPSSWSHQACTPWGPAVPPELSAEVLLEWSAAA